MYWSRAHEQTQYVLSFFAALFVIIPFCYIPAAAAVFVVNKRTGGELPPDEEEEKEDLSD